MNTFLIKYNPYTVETEIYLNEVPVAEDSILNIKNKRLQQWVNKAPNYLSEECNSKNFKVEFLGTRMDFEDLEGAVKENQENLNIKLSHIPVVEPENVEIEIESIFYKITHGPIEELKSNKLQEAFERVLHDEFDITVMATMSSGKSTLINSLLQHDIMPSSQEASTATIISIKDNRQDVFDAEAVDTQGNKVNYIKNIKLRQLEELNKQENVSEINVLGNIPFASHDDETSLVLIDTPGPNNSRDENHFALFEKTLNESSKSLVLYVLNASQFGINDDKALLEKIADSMKNGDKQSSDRYIFVINKIDTFDKGKDDVAKTLREAHKYLSSFGINNANIFPASSLTALQIRNVLNNVISKGEWTPDDEDKVFDVNYNARRLNRDNNLHLEKYTQYHDELPLNTNFDIELDTALGINLKNLETALLHSGIPSIEAYINLYINKYAKTIKIKNLIDVFLESLKSSKVMESMKQDIYQKKEVHTAIRDEIELIQKKLNSDEEAIKFKEEIDSIDISSEMNSLIKELKIDFETEISQIIKNTSSNELTISEANEIADNLIIELTKLYTELNIKLERNINEILTATGTRLLTEYKNKISHISRNMLSEDISINPVKLISGDLNIETSKIIDNIMQNKKVKVREEKIKNPERTGFLGALKIWKAKYISKDIYEKEEFILYDDMNKHIVTTTENIMDSILDDAKKDVYSNLKEMKFSYHLKFDEINKLLQERLENLKLFTNQSEKIYEDIIDSEKKLEWIEEVYSKLNHITSMERAE